MSPVNLVDVICNLTDRDREKRGARRPGPPKDRCDLMGEGSCGRSPVRAEVSVRGVGTPATASSGSESWSRVLVPPKGN